MAEVLSFNFARQTATPTLVSELLSKANNFDNSKIAPIARCINFFSRELFEFSEDTVIRLKLMSPSAEYVFLEIDTELFETTNTFELCDALRCASSLNCEQQDDGNILLTILIPIL